MKTSFDVIDILFPIINTASVTSLIDGSVYRSKKPLNSEAQDIVIIPQPVEKREDGDILTGSVIISIFSRDLPNGLPDTSHLNTVTQVVTAVLEAYSKTTDTYFAFDIAGEHTTSDRDNKTMSCTNLTLNYAIEG